MNVVDFLLLLLVAGLCGAAGRAIAGRTRGGMLVSIALGFVGALLGTYLAGLLHLPDLLVVRVGGANLPIVWSIVGAALFVALLGLMTRERRLEF